MAASRGRTNPSLAELLFQRGYEFSFFQAVRLLARVEPGRQPVGGVSPPASETVRFRTRQSFEFPASAIHQIERDGRGQPQMTVAFMGLTGRQGVLPFHYTEHVIRRLQEKDTTPAAFMDLFNHRLVSLFYRAWEKYYLPAQYEREQLGQVPPQRGFGQYLCDLIGLGTTGLRGRLSDSSERTLLFYAGLVAQRPHSASALEGILRDCFQVPVRVEQFRGKWFPLEDQELSYLRGAGWHNRLGEGAIAGDAVRNQQARIRLVVGPLSYSKFRAFLPGGRALLKLVELTQFIVDRSVEFDVQLSLLATEVPWCRLTDEGRDAPVLGLSSWLKTEEFVREARDVVLTGFRRAEDGSTVRPALA